MKTAIVVKLELEEPAVTKVYTRKVGSQSIAIDGAC